MMTMLLLVTLCFYTISVIVFSPYPHTTFISFSCIFPLMAGTKYILGTDFINRK